eukprot:6913876-Ditylum_brightwellii.AAC.1
MPPQDKQESRRSRETAKSMQLTHKPPTAPPTTTATMLTHNNCNNDHPQILPCVFVESVESRRQHLVYNNQQSGVKIAAT